jgi:parallel beta-helix repeat protein
MNDDRILEREMAAVFAESAPSRGPEQLLDHVFQTTGRARPRPRWLALTKEPPMRISSGVAVGSPMVRLATVLIATLLLAVLATGGVVIGASLLAPGAIVVAQDDSGTYTTITAAVAAANDGDTILVKPGVYRESITITDDITLRGDGPRDQVVIEVNAASPTYDGYWYGPSHYALILDGTNAAVSNLTLRGLGDATQHTAITFLGGSPLVDAITNEGFGAAAYLTAGTTGTIRDSTLGGLVSVNEGSPATIANNTISQHILVGNPMGTAAAVVKGNHLPGITVATPAGDWSGDGGPALIEDNVLELPAGETDLAPSDFRGINIQGADGVVVQRNTTSGFSIGIDVRQGASGTIVENRLNDNATGIQLQGEASVVGRNTINGGSYGIVAYSGSSTLEGNTVDGADTTGIHVGAVGTQTLTGNTLCGNAINLYVTTGADPVLTDNEVCPDGLAETGG